MSQLCPKMSQLRYLAQSPKMSQLCPKMSQVLNDREIVKNLISFI